MKNHKNIMVLALCFVLIVFGFTQETYAAQQQNANIPFEKILNGNSELTVTDLGKKLVEGSDVRVLLAKSTEAITDLKLIMGKDGYAVADILQEKMLIDPNGFYDENGTPSQNGGSYDADTSCWKLTSLEESCKVKNDAKSLKQALGDNLKSDNTYYCVFILF